MKIKDSTAKKIATDLVEEQIVCGCNNISQEIEYMVGCDLTEKQQEAIMEQVNKIAKRALIKINSDWKNYRLVY
tara:strand:- start:570 stop:791 length:222 start_codon:yes stop_codon:yes gene_type:complete